MNYIYDVLCNFQNVYYDFYDWNKTDDILRIRKIPIIKVNDEVYLDLKNNKYGWGISDALCRRAIKRNLRIV